MNDLLEQALEETKNLKKGEIFIVKDLFKGYLWNRYSKNDRLLLGRIFLDKVNKEIDYIEVIERKSASNQQKYKIKRR